MALRVAQSNAPEIGRSHKASPDRFSSRQITLVAAASACIALNFGGVRFDTDLATALTCAALLAFGLPHGSLDLALLRRAGHAGIARVGAVGLLYLGCAATMYAVWIAAPAAALAIFLVIACVHFAEDWLQNVPPFFAMALAAAVLTGPTLAQRDALVPIFAHLAGDDGATLITDIGMLLAPIALIAAGLGVIILARAGHHARAFEAGVIIAVMVALPPVIGFALFFCLSHSPLQFAKAKADLADTGTRVRRSEIVLLTLAAVGIAAAIYVAWGGTSLADGVVYASFVTLSILTVPHMAVPWLLQAGLRRAAAFCSTRESSSIE